MSRPATVAETILDGAVLLFKRPRSSLYQCRFRVGRQWYHRSTGERNRAAAVEKATELYFELKYKDKLGIPIVTRTFGSVAKATVKELLAEANGNKKAPAYLYAGFIERYFIPYFGDRNITGIDRAALVEHAEWRAGVMGRAPKATTVQLHNVALNRVFLKAVELKVITRAEIPLMVNTGEDTEARPAFSLEDYRKLYRFSRHWHLSARSQRERDRRQLLHELILILANTGMRPMNEVESITWGGVRSVAKDGHDVLTLRVDGKTGPRVLVARAGVQRYVDRIRARAQYEITDSTPLLLLPDGTGLRQPTVLFKQLLTEAGLLTDPETGADRTLYSLRHSYATWALVYKRVPIHTLAKQLGNSVRMIEKHYSKLNPLMASDQLLTRQSNRF